MDVFWIGLRVNETPACRPSVLCLQISVGIENSLCVASHGSSIGFECFDTLWDYRSNSCLVMSDVIGYSGFLGSCFQGKDSQNHTRKPPSLTRIVIDIYTEDFLLTIREFRLY